ncbi:IclR family transcriptional regulator [Aquibium sp. A9E412]|uniref:IclR family transcriptional regulator n=1 Tax=Aquibium sp. A9E412 TaxID=2976767 RepID=UPI0025AF3B7E|nr:IclR family transcriptional regulator [Aquibium sp. A9E412]MDN2566514.1 IclR family transcriptional regulator [Aquibium sp. A9E412]
MNETAAPARPDTAAPAARRRRSRVSGIDRVMQILDELQERGAAATAYDLARAIDAPLSTIYTIVDDMVDKSLLTRDADGAVWFGPRLYHYGLAYERSVDMLTIAKQKMAELNRTTGETVQICGRDGDYMVVLAMAEGNDHFQVTSRVGSRVPLNWTASGRLLVGHLPDAERCAIFAHGARVSPTGRADVDPASLSAQAARALREGVCVQAGESDYSVACIAAPIVDAAGACVATISIVLPEFKVQEDRARYFKAVREAAAEIEERVGWRRQRG